MEWRKLGLVFSPGGALSWSRSHASLPVPLHLEGDRFRVYFSSRDARQRSHVGWCELELSEAPRVLAVADEPVLAPGPLGHFDDHGVYCSSLLEADGRLWMYYVGWNPSHRPPLFYSSIGLAVSDDGGLSFERVSPAPVLARSEADPCLVTSPFVLRENGAWHMWYVSGFRWEREESGLRSFYDVKHATSPDGRTWERAGASAIALLDDEDSAARPCVLRDGGGFRMWFSRSSPARTGYLMGYAESGDGLRWRRLDREAGIVPGPEDWDSREVAYPAVFEHGGRLWLLYNGNGNGRAGFGLAVAAA